jgi:xylan 1,4-beta-xylosidase
MGKPQQASEKQYYELEKAGQLQLYTSPGWKKVDDGKVDLTFVLPSHAVSLIQLTW